MAREIGGKVLAKSLDEAFEAEIVFFAVPFINFKDVGSARPDWTGKIVVDATNAAFLPQDVQDGLAAEVPNPRRLGEPEEFARLAAFIVENGYMNGETIRIDGALRMR